MSRARLDAYVRNILDPSIGRPTIRTQTNTAYEWQFRHHRIGRTVIAKTRLLGPLRRRTLGIRPGQGPT